MTFDEEYPLAKAKDTLLEGSGYKIQKRAVEDECFHCGRSTSFCDDINFKFVCSRSCAEKIIDAVAKKRLLEKTAITTTIKEIQGINQQLRTDETSAHHLAYKENLAAAYECLYNLLLKQSTLKRALSAQEKVIAIRFELRDKYDACGNDCMKQQDFMNALAYYCKTLEVMRYLSLFTSLYPGLSWDLHLIHRKIGDVYCAQQEWQEALSHYQQSAEAISEMSKQDTELTTESKNELVDIYSRISTILTAMGDTSGAQAIRAERSRILESFGDEVDFRNLLRELREALQ